MFQVLAQKSKDSQSNKKLQEEDEVAQQNSILDNLPLAQEHLVFKFSSIDLQVKFLEIVASVNVTKLTPGVITSVIIAPSYFLPVLGLDIGMATSDLASYNWVLYCNNLSSHTFQDALPQEMLDEYPTINFDVKCLMTDPVTNQWIIFLPGLPHITKILSHLLSCHLQRILNKIS
jgi:hypothetical protein